MNLLDRLLRRPRDVETRLEQNVKFLGEQDGPPERELKARWIPILERFAGVNRAYLAILSYDDCATFQPALCISQPLHDVRQDLVNALSEPFRQLFNSNAAVDIMFIGSEHEEARLRMVCEPFYEREREY